MLKKNIDTTGRVVRLVMALLLLAYGIWQKSWIALAFSLFVFFEAFMSWCVINQLLGRNSCPIDKK